jgi:hypothetical protein
VKMLRSAIEIGAPAGRVWEILTDLPAYPEWNPFVRRIAGALTPGARLDVRLEPPGGAGVTLRPVVLVAEPERELRWRGSILVPGLFDGEHHLILEPLGGGRVRFRQEERFTGVLVPLLARSLDRHTLRGFYEMNAALKARAEAPERAPAGASPTVAARQGEPAPAGAA